MPQPSFGWKTSPVYEVETADGPVRVSVGVKTSGTFSGCPLLIVHHANGTWSMTRLNNEGAILATVHNQPTRQIAWHRMRAGLGGEDTEADDQPPTE